MTQDKKQQLLEFLKKLKRAAELDAISEPERLKKVLELEVLEMQAFERQVLPKGAPSGSERVKYVSRSLTAIKANVPVIDAARGGIAYEIRIAGPDTGRAVFTVRKLHEQVCLSEADVAAIFGKRQYDLPLPSHPPEGYYMGGGYAFPSARGASRVSFSYERVGGQPCVETVTASFLP